MGTIEEDIDAFLVRRIVEMLLESQRMVCVAEVFPTISVEVCHHGWHPYDIQHLQRLVLSEYIDIYDRVVGI
jgi:hypothetical protein